uniref:Uncharacterized protein n=1 Tax=Anguilla anguilla TaxID=7936 RepID=A0A0E9XQ07_ANGAN
MMSLGPTGLCHIFLLSPQAQEEEKWERCVILNLMQVFPNKKEKPRAPSPSTAPPLSAVSGHSCICSSLN